MLDHITVSVSDFDASKAFYTRVLSPLGYGVVMEFPGMCGFGPSHKPYLWLKEASIITTPQHIAFMAKDRAAVDAFHAAALSAGAKDDGSPGVRADYHPNYYGAFVIDPLNAHPIEAVCHLPPAAAKPAKKAAPAKKAVPKRKAAAKKSARRGR
jgi:catechol 2,3-dioxygenase-like lactoylglutathione lyase family enzyme